MRPADANVPLLQNGCCRSFLMVRWEVQTRISRCQYLVVVYETGIFVVWVNKIGATWLTEADLASLPVVSDAPKVLP